MKAPMARELRMGRRANTAGQTRTREGRAASWIGLALRKADIAGLTYHRGLGAGALVAIASLNLRSGQITHGAALRLKGQV
jgi:hypothetical protein